MVTPGEGFVDKGKLIYFGGRPFVENGEFATGCPHSTFLGLNSKGDPIHRIPFTFVMFQGHPEEYKTKGVCVLCVIDFFLSHESKDE